MDPRTDRALLFAALERPETTSALFDRVPDDVDWTAHCGRAPRHRPTYDNSLCWVCRFDSADVGARIVEVRA